MNPKPQETPGFAIPPIQASISAKMGFCSNIVSSNFMNRLVSTSQPFPVSLELRSEADGSVSVNRERKWEISFLSIDGERQSLESEHSDGSAWHCLLVK